MLILPHSLSLITTHHCTAACDHCCFSCSPKITTRIPKEKITSLIEEAQKIPTMKLVCFTGGECFTLGNELDEHISHATRLGFVTRCITNGYWAFSLEHARRRIKKARESGLKEINFSTGTFHQKHVPIERILNGTLAAAEVGIFVVINMEICDQSDESINNIILKNEKLIELHNSKKILIQRTVWIEADGNTSLSHPENRSRFHPNNISSCRTVLNVLSVTPTQDLIACCGLHLEKIDELHLGSLKDKSIMNVLKNSKDDLLKIWIHLDGVEEVYIQAQKEDPSISLPYSSTHPCETCLSLYKNKEAFQAIQKVVKKHEKDIMERYMQKLTLQMFDRNVVS
ncbi:radical SAM protein [Silvanigrella sp.]|jgi:organic radical activating enzyme|uniref:radical SAM protein n=1 Tax=Silvanigrella sp. TaxID=2024976 RepID=UPI0037C7737E